MKKSPFNELTQQQIVVQFLQKHVATASMVSDATGVPQKCITWYKRELEKSGVLWEVERKRCQITGRKAFYLTTNPLIVEKNWGNQLDFFGF